ncbi:MAG: hydrophobe/amphiphile efflux-1 family RND transporter, partial [Alphaproteobacteria bacterium]|nr:hydrophobe/amphiphile efflux-1 family RND transporter [Alphaproteobacteria bacterium]
MTKNQHDNIGNYFVTRPIFASVIALFMLVVGAVSYFLLPVAQYPEVAPPTVNVRAAYPGANAETVAKTVATPLEEQINGVENMLYMSSYSTSDGSMSLTVTFRTGTDLDKAQVQVQNRVAQAEPRLPEEVRRLGVSTAKSGADLMLVVHMLSPDDSFDQLYISNYALLKVKDQLTRIDGVGNVMLFGLREYSLRIWMDPDKLSGLGLTSGDVIRSLREQNIQVSSGTLGEPPVAGQNAFQLSIATQGRFEEPEQFENVVIKSGDDGRLTRLRDVARVELGARDYVTNSYLNNKPAVALAIFQRPGSNALSIAGDVKETMQEISKTFPKGIEYRIVYNPTDFIQQSIEEVLKTLAEAILLVVLVIILFLHKWRASLIPILTIPVSLVGTFAVMAAFGFSLNMLTLFA